MGQKGVEPLIPYGREILSLKCIPVPPLPLSNLISISLLSSRPHQSVLKTSAVITRWIRAFVTDSRQESIIPPFTRVFTQILSSFLPQVASYSSAYVMWYDSVSVYQLYPYSLYSYLYTVAVYYVQF